MKRYITTFADFEMLSSISDTEISFCCQGCEEDVRYDGRGSSDYRPISLENNIFPHLNGSSRVRVSGSTDIICSVKLEIAEPDSMSPNSGILEFHVNISPSCKISMDDKSLKAFGNLIANNLQSIYSGSSCINLEDFGIIAGKYCWSIQIDLVVLEMDGDPSDICSIATLVALRSCKVPKVEILIGEFGAEEDFEISSDLADGLVINCCDVPICICVVKVGSVLIVDCNSAEHACADSAVSIAIDPKGMCRGMMYMKSGIMEVAELQQAAKLASWTALVLYRELENFWGATVNKESKFSDTPLDRKGLLNN